MGEFRLESANGDAVASYSSGCAKSQSLQGPIKGFQWVQGWYLVDKIHFIYELSPSCDTFLVSSLTVNNMAFELASSVTQNI